MTMTLPTLKMSGIHSRFSLALRFSLGLILPFTIAFLELLDNPFITLVPMFYLMLIIASPPFQASIPLFFILLLAGIIPGMAIGTAAIAATISTGEAWAGYLVILGSIIVALPMVGGKLRKATAPFFMNWVMMPCILFISFLDFILTGVVYGDERADVLQQCIQLAQNPTDSPYAKDPLVQSVIQFTCGTVSDPNLTGDVSTCVPWPTAQVAMVPNLAYLNDFLSGETLCININQNFVHLSISPGMWIVDFIWSSEQGSAAAIPGLFIATGIAMACVALVLVILPPSLYARDAIKTEMITQLKRFSSVYSSLSSSESQQLTESMKEVEKIRPDALDSLANLVGFEPYWGSAFQICYWHKLAPLVSSFGNLRECLVVLGKSDNNEICKTLELEALLLRTKELIEYSAGVISISSSGLSKECLSATKEMVQKEMAIKQNAVTESWNKLTFSSTRVDTENVFYMTCVERVVYASMTLSKEMVEFVNNQMTSSYINILFSILGLLRGLAVPFISILLGLIALIKGTIRLFTPTNTPKGVEKFKVLHEKMWKTKIITYQIQLFVALAIVLFPPIFFPAIRNWKLNPVGALPSGKVGLWATYPVLLMLLPTKEGSTKKMVLRCLGSLVGAVIGLGAAFAFQKSIAGGIALVVGVTFIFVFFGVSGETVPGKFGAFHDSYGYAFSLGLLTVCIIAIESSYACSEVANPDSNCEHTPYEITAIRLLGQLFAAGVTFLVVHIVFPRNGAFIVRESISLAISNIQVKGFHFVQRVWDNKPTQLSKQQQQLSNTEKKGKEDMSSTGEMEMSLLKSSASGSQMDSLDGQPSALDVASSDRLAEASQRKQSKQVVTMSNELLDSSDEIAVGGDKDEDESRNNEDTKRGIEELLHIFDYSKEQINLARQMFDNTTIFDELPFEKAEREIPALFENFDKLLFIFETLLFSVLKGIAKQKEKDGVTTLGFSHGLKDLSFMINNSASESESEQNILIKNENFLEEFKVICELSQELMYLTSDAVILTLNRRLPGTLNYYYFLEKRTKYSIGDLLKQIEAITSKLKESLADTRSKCNQELEKQVPSSSDLVFFVFLETYQTIADSCLKFCITSKNELINQ